jgi:hypothetical protein
MRNFLINNWIVIVIGVALVASMLMAIRNKQIIQENSALQKQSELVKELTKEILSGTMHGLDIGLRGFALTREEKMLEPYKKAIETNADTFRNLEQILTQQGYAGLAQSTYNAAIRGNLILQVCMVLLALPALILFMKRITKEREAREKLLLEVEQNDRKFVFDPGTERHTDAKVVINTSIKNIRTASDFIKAMSREEYDVTWNGLTDDNQNLNKDTGPATYWTCARS